MYAPRSGSENMPAVAITSLDKVPAELAVAGYDRYGSVTNFLNFQGHPMPWFGDLPPTIQKAWFAGVDLSVGDINKLLRLKDSYDRGSISDGYHTFDELYMHRICNFIALAKQLDNANRQLDANPSTVDYLKRCVWRSMLHHDGKREKGYFIAGIGTAPGHQITYHMTVDWWDKLAFAETLQRAPEWDGHTPKDVLTRLLAL